MAAATPFDQENMNFSQLAHEIALETIYKPFWGEFDWDMVDKTGSEADMWQGVDCVAYVENLSFSVQERFRREKYSDYREVTVTASNDGTGRKGDFQKLVADQYVYGYLRDAAAKKYAEDGTIVENPWVEAVIVDVPFMKMLYLDGDIEPEKAYYKRKNQTILGFPFDELDDWGAIYYHIDG